MARYHLNPFSGEPNVCKATVKPCPWGGAEAHYATVEAARFAYELQMKAEEVATSKRLREEAFDTYAASVDPAYHERLAERLQEEVDRRLAFEARERELTEELEARRLARPYLSRERALEVPTDGITCPMDECGQQLTPLQASLILNEMHSTACKKCGVEFGLYEVKIAVGESKDTHPAFQAENVSAMSWYHSTTSAEWGDQLQTEGGFYAHLGSQQAAFDRQIAENYTSTSTNQAGFYLFEVAVAEDSRIGSRIDLDENQDYNIYHPETKPLRQMASAEETLEGPVDVVRYVNKWEDMASISLVAATPKLTVKSVREVSREEALSSLSLYNISDEMAQEEKANLT